MVRFIYPVIRAFWLEETSIYHWNFGLITNVYKGKGDREQMKNQRGITVSSTIGTIVEDIIYNRMTRLMSFTQFQAGGRKGGSTTDHVFALKNMITICKKEKRKMIINLLPSMMLSRPMTAVTWRICVTQCTRMALMASSGAS